jgi:hypothetical protein
MGRREDRTFVYTSRIDEQEAKRMECKTTMYSLKNQAEWKISTNKYSNSVL